MSYSIIRFSVGDQGDGHNQITHFNIVSNKTKEELVNAYAQRDTKLGFKFSLVCADCEENKITPEVKEKFFQLGISLKDIDPEYMCPDDFFTLWMRVLKFLEPSFEYQMLQTEKFPRTEGYGCYRF